MAKGAYKKRNSQWKKGSGGGGYRTPKSEPNVENTDEPAVKRRLIRPTREKQSFISENTDNGLVYNVKVAEEEGNIIQVTADLPVIEGVPTDETALRPLPEQEIPPSNKISTNIIVNKAKMCDMWNRAFKEHIVSKPNCQGNLWWDEEATCQWGLSWRAVVKCLKCRYRSPQFKLYEEIESGSRGPNPSAIDIGVQIGLSKNGMSNAGLVEILTAANIKPAAFTTLQRAANTVGKIIVEENEEDLAEKCEKIKDYHISLGENPDHPTPVEADATYNNALFSGVGKTPFQAGTQCVLTVSENLTSSKSILAVKTYSKLCSCTPIEDRRRKKNVGEYSGHLADCTANLEKDSSIGNEGSYLEEAVEDLNKNGVFIGDLTIDGDSSGRADAAHIQQSNGSNITVKYCTWHLKRILERSIRGSKFSEKMFHGRNKTERQQVHNRFTYDISFRVTAEFETAHKQLQNDIPEIIRRMPGVIDAIIDCYRGDCSNCDEHSFVCRPGDRWSRPFLDINPASKSKRCTINATGTDLESIRRSLAIRLGETAINKTSNQSTQNKSEAVNKGIKKATPKQLTFKRNYHARVNSAIHSMNNGPGTSIIKLCKAVGVGLSSVVYKKAKRMDKVVAKHQARKKSAAYKLRRRMLRQKNYRLWDEKKEKERPGYIKDGALEEVLYIPPPGLEMRDHNYQSNKITVL